MEEELYRVQIEDLEKSIKERTTNIARMCADEERSQEVHEVDMKLKNVSLELKNVSLEREQISLERERLELERLKKELNG